MGLCQYVDLCFHASSLPCLHTFWHAIPTSFYIFNVFFFYFLVYNMILKQQCLIPQLKALGTRRESTSSSISNLVTPTIA